MDRPTLYLNSCAWVAARRRDGTWPLDRSGRVFTIMARPRTWERGDGRVPALIPDAADLAAYHAGALTLAAYRERLETRWAAWRYSGRPGPNRLRWDAGRWEEGPVQDGDTLCCACSAAASRAGECHRAWAAPFLVRAGWRVVLDGEEVPGE